MCSSIQQGRANLVQEYFSLLQPSVTPVVDSHQYHCSATNDMVLLSQVVLVKSAEILIISHSDPKWLLRTLTL